MGKKLEDYLHLYLGCKCIITDNKQKSFKGILTPMDLSDFNAKIISIKLILRSLDSMTEDEKKEFIELCGLEPEDISCLEKKRDEFFPAPEMSFGTAHLTNIAQWSIGVKYLLSKYFDLFQLIESGLAINEKELSASTQ